MVKKLIIIFMFYCFVLTVNAAPIIQDGWEDTGIGEWVTVTPGSSTVDPDSAVSPFAGSENLRITLAGTVLQPASFERTFTAQQALYLSFFWKGTNVNISETEEDIVLIRDTSGNICVRVRLAETGGVHTLKIGVWTNGGYTYHESVAQDITKYILIQASYDLSNSTYSFYLDGTKIGGADLTGSVRSDIANIKFKSGNSSPTDVVDFDNIALSATEFESQAVEKRTILPDQDLANVEWLTSNGSDHYLLLSDDLDDTYVYTTIVQKTETIGFANPTDTTHDPLTVRIITKGQTESSTHNASTLKFVRGAFEAQQDIHLSTEIDYRVYERLLDPEGIVWTWTNLNDLRTTLYSRNVAVGGGRISKVWADILAGKSGFAGVLTDGPYFGGVLDDGIKVHVRVSNPGYIAIRYGTVEADVRANTGDTVTTASSVVTSSEDYGHIFELTSLIADTTYYFDIVVNGQSWASVEGNADPIWGTLPNCKTLQADIGRDSFTFVGVADRHNSLASSKPDIYKYINDKSPDFILDLGDIETTHSDDPDVIREKIYNLRGYNVPNTTYINQVGLRYPQEYIWSDHDYGTGNNCGKYGGEGNYPSPTWGKSYLAYNTVTEAFPMYDLVHEDIIGTATGGSATTLINTSVNFETLGVFPGQVVWHTVLGNEGAAIVQSVSGDTITFTTALTGGESFVSTDTYHIKHGGLYRTWNVGTLARFIMIDSRYKRDPNLTPDGDWLDGRNYGAGTGADDADGTATGHLQRDWLVAQINGCNETWIFLVSDVPFLSSVPATDRIAAIDPNDTLRDYLMANCQGANIIWVSGDIHDAGLDDASDVDDLWPSISVGRLGGSIQDQGTWLVNGVDNHFIDSDKYNFAAITVSETVVTAQIIDNTGAVMGTMTIRPVKTGGYYSQ